MKKTSRISGLACRLPRFWLGLLCLAAFSCRLRDTGWGRVPEIIRQIALPDIPERDFRVTEFGAIGDGSTDCTEAIRKAIEACHAAGGGRILFPSGVFSTGAVHLKSRVGLHLAKDAVLLFSRDTEKFLPPVFTRFEGAECMNYSPFIYAFEQEHLSITGEGRLDGQADTTVWWTWAGKDKYGWKPGMPESQADREKLFEMAERNVPVEDRVFGRGHTLRPSFIQFYRCRNVLVEGITIVRSPMWEIHPVLCENVTVQNVRVVTHGPNNDGCNPESCRRVWIRNCYFDTGDDCIAIKSGRNGDGRRVGVPSEDILIQGCTMKDGHGGVVIGSEISGSCRNVFAEDCAMDSPNLERALRIKTNSLRGGVIENIHMRNVTVGQVSDAILLIDYYYGEGDVGSFAPVVRGIFLENVTSEKSPYALRLLGYPRSPISGVVLRDCVFNGVENSNQMENVTGLKFIRVSINGRPQ